MAFRDYNSGQRRSSGPRQMVQGNWTCAGCGAEITELPFEPLAGKPVHCRDCWSKNKPQKTFTPRPMIKGSWACVDCGTEITELAFEPSADRPVYCRDCWGKRRSQR